MNLNHSVFIVKFSIENIRDPPFYSLFNYFYSSTSLMFTSAYTQVVNITEGPVFLLRKLKCQICIYDIEHCVSMQTHANVPIPIYPITMEQCSFSLRRTKWT